MIGFIDPDWPVPAKVRALQTTRTGGVSGHCFASFNLGMNCGDDHEAVLENRRRLRAMLPDEPAWPRQVHGRDVVDWSAARRGETADAVITDRPGQVCAVLTADCLPVLLADADGREVAAVHAGWRGLAAGILEQGVEQLGVAPEEQMAWLGPAISADRFEVGSDVYEAFVHRDAAAAQAFREGRGGHWQADLYSLAAIRLRRAGVPHIYGGGYCTYAEARRFYSYRREGQTGRMATLIWLDPAAME